MQRIIVLLLVMVLGQYLLAQEQAVALEKGDLVACGDDQVVVLDGKKALKSEVAYKWKWRTEDAKDVLPAVYQRLLSTLDDCKPVDHNSKLLVTSSSGGTVLLDVATKKVLFYAQTPMAHSADFLPGGWIVVANSTHDAGNSLELYDSKHPEEVIAKDSLYSGHGAVWDDAHQQLLALGFSELRAYKLINDKTAKPELTLLKSYKLPDEGGHELSIMDQNRFLVSTHHGVWIFDWEKENFEPFAPLAKRQNIKSANYDAKTKSLVYTVAEDSWWTFHIYGENPTFKLNIPTVKLYKVRVAD